MQKCKRYQLCAFPVILRFLSYFVILKKGGGKITEKAVYYNL